LVMNSLPSIDILGLSVWAIFSPPPHGAAVGQMAEVVQDLSDTVPLAPNRPVRFPDAPSHIRT
jgi:hypothetical protein